MDINRIIYIVYLLISQAGDILCYDYTTAKALYDNLTTSYNTNVRPSASIIVRVEFSALSVNELDVREQAFTVSGWFTLLWHDPQLLWTPSSFGNIETMFFKEKYVWKPELVITNAIDGVPVIESEDVQMKVAYNGMVTWEPPGAYRVSCDVDITYYPFDTQTCFITVSTWSHDNSIIELAQYVSGINFDVYSENGEWTLKASSITEAEESDRNEETISRDALQFNFTFKRKPTFYVLNVILPPLVTAFLGLAVFLLPAESGEKVGYSITVLLALAVLLTIVTTYIPTTSKHTSILGLYLVVMMCISAAEVIITMLVLRIHHKADKSIPVSKRWQKFANIILTRTSFNCFCIQHGCCGNKKKLANGLADENHSNKNSKQKIAPLRIVNADNFNVIEFEQFETDTKKTIMEMKNVNNDDDSTGDLDSDSGNMAVFAWPEIAAMIDTTFFFIMLIVRIVSSFAFLLVLSQNG